MKFILHSAAPAIKYSWLKMLAVAALLVFNFNSYGQENKQVTQNWSNGADGITVKLKDIMAQQKYMQDNNLIPIGKNRRQETNEIEFLRQKFDNPNSPKVSSYKDPSLSENIAAGIASTYAIGTSFDAVAHADITQGWLPPDPMVAAGPSQLCVTVNGRIRFFDKAGNMTFDIDADVFFPAAIRGNSNVVDPRVRYDATSQRWFIAQINIVGSNNRILLAVSSGSVITDQTSFTLFQFQQNLPKPPGDNGLFADYESLGVDANAVYIGCNMFNSTLHSSVWVIQKSKLFAGKLKVAAFRNIGNATAGGIYTPQGVSNNDPAATEGYFIGTDSKLTGLLVMRRVTFGGGGPTLSGNLNITVPSTAFPISVPTKGGSTLAAIDARILLATIHKDAGGQTSLWCSHSILVNSAGVGTASGDRNGVRWYQIGSLTGTPSLLQSGTLFDNTASKISYWMGTIAMNNNGDAMISCSSSSATTGANGVVTAHFASAGAGTTAPPTATTVNNTGYTGGRWGDYSSSCVDPTDNTTFWVCHEYVKNGDYVVRVAKVTITNGPVTAVVANEAEAAEAKNFSATLFPNPAAQSIKIQLNKAVNSNIRFTITNSNGNVVLEKTVAANTGSWLLDVSKLKNGVYFANIVSEDGLHTRAIKFEKN